MNRFVLDLLLCCAHQITDSCLGVFCPVGLDVGDLHVQQFSIESAEERHQEVFLTLNPEVVVGEVESPGVCARLSKHKEVFSTSDKPERNQSS